MQFSLTAALLLATAFVATASPRNDYDNYGAGGDEYGPSPYWRDGARVHLRRRDQTYLNRCYGCLDRQDTCAVQGGMRPWNGGDDDTPTVWIVKMHEDGSRGAFCDERDGQYMHRSHQRRGRHLPLCFERALDENRGYWAPHWNQGGYASFRHDGCRLGYCERKDCPWGGRYGVFGGLADNYFGDHGDCDNLRIEDAGERGYASGGEGHRPRRAHRGGYERAHDDNAIEY